MVMADSGVWIDLLNNERNETSEILAKLLTDRKKIAVNYLVIAEVLQGFQNEKEYQRIKRALESLELIEIKYDTIIKATNIFRACQKGRKQNDITGQTLKTIDCIIASNCIENDIELLHNDRHFDFIQTITGQLKGYNV